MKIVENHINQLQDFEISSRIDCRDVEREIASSFHFILSDNNLQNNFFNLSFQTIYRILSNDQLSLTNQQELFPKFFQRFLEIKGKQYYFLLIDLENKLEIETISKIISNEQFDIETFKSNKNSRIIMKDYQNHQIIKANENRNIQSFERIEGKISSSMKKLEDMNKELMNIKNFSYKIIQSQNIAQGFHKEIRQEVKFLRKSITIPYKYQSQGIFEYIKEQMCDGTDLIKKGFVNITANSKNHENEMKKNNIIDWTTDSVWSSEDKTNSYILFDFLNHRIVVMGIKIQTNNQRTNGEHMKDIFVQGSNSNNSNDWNYISNWETNNLNYPSKTGYYCIDSVFNDNFYRYIKIEMKDQNYSCNNKIVLKHIDFFGRFSL